MVATLVFYHSTKKMFNFSLKNFKVLIKIKNFYGVLNNAI